MKNYSYILILALIVVLLSTRTAKSEDKEYQFNVPSQSLAAALELLAEQSNSISFFRYNLVESKQSNDVIGRYSLPDALSIMLSGTGLSGGLSNRRVIKVSQIDTSNHSNNEDETLKTKKFKKTSIVAAFIAAIAGGPADAQQVDTNSGNKLELEEILVVGSRSGKARSAADLAVPVDVFRGDELTAVGGSVDITDGLRSLIPSYTATPLTGDGSAFVRSTSLRGLAADQTLILVNGKRRHRSALVQFAAAQAGAGSHAPDVALIPAIALKNVEVLRDGAAAQYGSDAIAGVINFELKDASEGGSFEAQYGQHFEGEDNFKIAGNAGLSLGGHGFLNVSFEHIDNESLSRGLQRPAGQALIDAGIAGVGADSPFGDAPFVQTWGRPESSGTRLFYNSGIELANGLELYSHGNYGDVTGRTRFFFRTPDNSAITGTEASNPFLDAATFLPQGFTPFLDGDQTDLSFVSGIRGETAGGLVWDASVGYGSNELKYTLNNTLNPDLVAGPDQFIQRDFDLGGYKQEELNFNLDFTKPLSDSMNLAFGFEYRDEDFSAITGEPNALIGRGTSGLRAPSPEAAAEDNSRSNVGAYIDIEQDISDAWLVQYALRYEDFDDFGGTLNGKVASRVSINDTTNLRGSISTGFHAPTPGQANIQTVLTTINTNAAGDTQLVEVGLVPASSPTALLAGGSPLREETSLGFTTQIGSAALTVDGYIIEIDDRIYQTTQIAIPGSGGSSVSFFTNGLDIESKGIDVVLSDSIDWGGDASTDYTFAYAYNQVDVTDRVQINGAFPISTATAEDIENNYPDHRFTFSTNTQFTEKLDLLVRANYFGKHFDERGEINGPAGNRSLEIGATVFVDVELGYQLSDALRFVLGASNIFDEFPDEIPNDGVLANRQSVGLQFPRRTPVNYDGGSYYARLQYDF